MKPEHDLMDYLPDAPTEAAAEDALRLRSGEQARIGQTPDGTERFEIVSPTGELLFAFSPQNRVTQVVVSEGDLKFVAERGSIELDAAHRVRIAGTELELTTHNLDPATNTSLWLRPGQARLKSAIVGLLGRRGEVLFDETNVVGKRIQGTVDRAKLVTGRLEVVADTVRSRAENVFQKVEKLWETRAGRLRTLVGGTYQLNSEQVTVKAKKDVNIDGKMLYLG